MFNNIYYDILSKKLLILGALNYLAIPFLNINLISNLGEFTHQYISIILYLIIGIAGIYQISKRDFYLPFLGQSAYPCGNLMEKVPQDATIVKTIKTTPNINVIYWAAEPNTNVVENPWDAYDKNANSGVAKSDKDGNAILQVRKPASYKVPHKRKELKPHIHYRECFNNSMLSPVKTIYLKKK